MFSSAEGVEVEKYPKGRMQIAVIPFIQQHRKPWDVLGFGPFPSHAFICTHCLEIPLRYITREQRWCTLYGHMTSVCVRFLTSWSWAAVGLDSGFLSKAIFRKSLNSIDLKYTKPLNVCTRGGYNLLLCNGDKITFDSQSYSRNVKSYKSKKKSHSYAHRTAHLWKESYSNDVSL